MLLFNPKSCILFWKAKKHFTQCLSRHDPRMVFDSLNYFVQKHFYSQNFRFKCLHSNWFKWLILTYLQFNLLAGFANSYRYNLIDVLANATSNDLLNNNLSLYKHHKAYQQTKNTLRILESSPLEVSIIFHQCEKSKVMLWETKLH